MSALSISFGNLRLAYTAYGDRGERLLDFAFRNQESLDGDGAVLHSFELSEDSSGDLLIHSSGQPISRSPSDAVTALRLIERATYHFADRCDEGPVLHAGCIGLNNQGILLVGGSGSGKTCLTTWLLAQGFDYLTDELALLSGIPDSFVCQGFARPLNLKRSAQSLFPECIHNDQSLSSPSGSLIRPEAAQALAPLPGQIIRQVGLSRIIFPSFRPGESFSFSPLPKAKAALLLMQNLVNARNLPEHGFHRISSICNSTPAFTLCYSSFNQIDPLHLTHA